MWQQHWPGHTLTLHSIYTYTCTKGKIVRHASTTIYCSFIQVTLFSSLLLLLLPSPLPLLLLLLLVSFSLLTSSYTRQQVQTDESFYSSSLHPPSPLTVTFYTGNFFMHLLLLANSFCLLFHLTLHIFLSRLLTDLSLSLSCSLEQYKQRRHFIHFRALSGPFHLAIHQARQLTNCTSLCHKSILCDLFFLSLSLAHGILFSLSLSSSSSFSCCSHSDHQSQEAMHSDLYLTEEAANI